MVSVCLTDRLHSRGHGRLLLRSVKGSCKVGRSHRPCVHVTPHPGPRVNLEKDWEENFSMTLGTHFDKERGTCSCDGWKGVAFTIPRKSKEPQL